MTYTAQGHTTIRRARNGKGIASMLSLFAISDKRKVAAYGDISGWTETLPTATEQKPYLWQVVKTTYTTGDEEYSTPVLVATYSAAANANLLENASFVSAKRMDAWTTQSVYQAVTGQTAPDTSADGHGISTSEQVEGRNSYYDVCEATSSVVEYKNVLQQKVATSKLTKGAWHTLSFWAKGWQELMADRTYYDSITEGTTRTLSLKAGVTYTLTITASVTALAMTNKRVLRCRLLNGTTEVASHDFSSSFALTWITSVTPNADTDYTLTIALYDKSASMVSISGVTGTVETAYLTDNMDLQTYLYSKAIVDTAAKIYMDGVELTPNSDLGLTWALSTTWAKHTLTFKTKSSLSGNTNVLFRLPPCLADGADRKVWICMPKLETGFFATAFIDSAADAKGEDGDAGIAGQIVRTSEWTAGVTYHNDTEPTDDGIRWLDVVTITENGVLNSVWQCVKTHVGSDTNKPSTTSGTTVWKQMNVLSPIYTSMIMANNAVLRVAQSNRIAVMSTDGTAVQGCLTGVSNATDYMMWIGGTSAASANFRVKYDGTMEATGCNVYGTVKASNFYHGTYVLNGANTLKWYYCEGYDADNYPYTAGQYYNQDDVDTIGGGETAGLVSCTGPNDIIICPMGSSPTTTRYVVLPRPQDYEGKVVEIYDCAYAQNGDLGSIIVSAADGSSCIVLGLYNNTVSTKLAKIIITGGHTSKFLSYKDDTGCYWVLLQDK